jgi:uncharacterized RDD family membrane protein YckC
MALGLVYEVCFTATRGQTPGKEAVGIQIVGPDGRPPGWMRAIKRTGLGIVAGALPGPAGEVGGPLVEARVFWDKERQGYHDLFAGTHVVRRTERPRVRTRRAN